MEKLLRLYTYVDGGINDTPFPNADNPIEIGAFRYDAKRMGGAPTITASVNHASCLDDEWTYNVYAMFNGEKFYLKQIPTSSYNNTSAMYKHDIELVSERVALDNVYFFDVVSDDIVDDDKPVSNSTKVVFFGDVREFANRLKASLQYSALDYDVVVDADVVSEEKLVSFEDQFFSNVLQEIYNTYEVPYYFEGKTIHIGYSKPNEELPSFAYGVDDALLSISKNNANYKVVNRATGTGSSENIPYYYPNNSPKGNIDVESELDVRIVNAPLFANEIDTNGEIVYQEKAAEISKVLDDVGNIAVLGKPSLWAEFTYKGFSTRYKIYIDTVENGKVQLYLNPLLSFTRYQTSDDTQGQQASGTTTIRLFVDDRQVGKSEVSVLGEYFEFDLEEGSHVVEANISFAPEYNSSTNVFEGNVGLEWGIDTNAGWRYNGKEVTLKDIGLSLPSGVTPTTGDTIKQILIEYINTSQNLLPSKYRDTKGVERFYNATNDTYEGVTFNNPFVAGKPKEHIFKVEDIKPSIEGMLVNGQRIDMFEAFAYDEDDNDETYQDEDGNVYFKHPYFFAKLKPLGFNLFDHAIEQQPMTISFTSGACGACNFEIAVDEESQKNTVQVDANGDLIYEDGRVLCGAEGSGQGDVQPQPEQQDTTNHSVWIALQKEEETYGIFMPKAPINGVGGHRPSTEDTFVILGINLPDEYILNAERRLEAEIIKYLQDNNDEKFTFSIGFSRIYFAENEDVLNSLNENSKIQITYDNKTYDLYVSSFSYTMSESDALPEIKVELDETLKTSQNAIQKAINEVKTTLGSAINEVSQGVAMQRRSYVSKVQDDTAMGVVDFSKGVKFGEGGKVEILDNNSAKLTIEYLEVTKKATFTSLEIQEKTHVGGQMLVTPASMNCGEVEEFEGFYRCYFQTKGADGSEEIFNQFVVGDQAICQTFNAWGSKYYWRLVVGVGEDYVDLSKEDCDEGSGAPEAGDRIIQMGNREDEARQNAIVIAAHGDNSPYIVQYKGINNFDLPKTDNDPRITTLLSPTKNILTGQVKMVAGSSGLELFEEWAEKQALIDSKASGEDFDAFKNLVDKDIENIKKQVDGAITTWFYDAEPTLNNAPAVDWATYEDKNNHLGDLYYSGAGKAYRFQYDEATSAYYWNIITDEDITEALALAQKAQDTADGKRRVFVDTPTTPYDEGDLWSQGPTLPMMICINSRSEGAIQEGDWDFADNTSQLATQIAGYEYIKEAIQNGSTIVTGGLIQSGVLMLGYTNANGQYQVMSGTNGVYDANKMGGGIAAWYGGAMSEDSAKTVLRFDGSGFFANKNITWDNEGGASFAGGKITITKEGALTFSDTIAFGSGGDSVSTVLEKLSTLLSYFTLDGGELSTTYQVRIKNNLIVEQDTSSGGEGQDTPGAGLDEDEVLDIVKGYTYSKSEINKLIDDVNAGDVDLTNYYTKQEVDAKIPSLDGYAKEGYVDDAITALNVGQYAKASDLENLQGEVDNIETVLGLSETAEGYINTWTEVVAFLDGYKNADDLATILSGINADIAKNAENIVALDKDKADKATTLAGYGITDAYTKSDLESYKTWWDAVMGLVVKDGNNIRIKTNLIIEGDTSSGGSGQDTPASGTVTGIKVSASETLTPNNAGIVDMVSVLSSIDVSDQLKDYAKLTDITKSRIDSVLGSTTAGNANRFLMSTGSTSVWAAISKDMVTDALGYTPLSTGGGTVTGSLNFNAGLSIKSANNIVLEMYSGVDTYLRGSSHIYLSTPSLHYQDSSGTTHTILHSGNYSDYALPKSGGTMKDAATIKWGNNKCSWDSAPEGFIGMSILREDAAYGYYAGLSFKGYYGFQIRNYAGTDTYEVRGHNYLSWGTWRTLIHSGNIGDYALPLTGGTISGDVGALHINRSNEVGSFIGYSGTNGTLGYLGFRDAGIPGFFDANWNAYFLIHSGNIGSQNAGSADVIAKTYANENINYANNESKIRLIKSTVSNSTELGFPDSYTSGISVMTDYTGWQMVTYGSIGVPNPFFRSFGDDGRRSEWKQLAFLDDNVASATKLETGKNIWGHAFDGSSPIEGVLYGVTGVSFSSEGAITNLNGLQAIDIMADYVNIGYGYAIKGKNTLIGGNNLYLRYGTSQSTGILLNSSGNVLIGTTDDKGGKLQINNTSGSTSLRINSSVVEYGFKYNGIGIYHDNDIKLGFGWNSEPKAESNVGAYFKNYVSGDVISLFNEGGIFLGGNVGIGTTSPAAKLHVSYNSGTAGIEISRTSNGDEASIAFNSDEYSMRSVIGGWGKNLNFYHNGATRMTISDTGAVTMSSSLSVGGSIKMGDNTHLDGGSNHLIFTSPNYTTFGMGSKFSYLDGSEIYLRTSGATAVTIASNGAVTMSSTLSVSGTTSIGVAQSVYDSSRAQLSVISSQAQPAMLWLGSNSEKKWSIESRGSGDNYRFSLYSWVAAKHLLYITHEGDATINGNLVVSGDTSSGSDIRFKDIIKNKTIKIEHIAKAPLFTFKWNDREDDTIHLGSSAQYWEKVTPWLVKGEDFKTLDYSTLGVAMGISLAKKAVNHEERIKVLERKVKSLEEENRRLRYGN